MKEICSALDAVCRKEPFREKILIMPSFQAGGELLNSYSLAGYFSINLSVSTVLAEVGMIAIPVLENSGMRRAEQGQIAAILEKILAELREAGSIEYFADIKPEFALGPMICASLQELRSAGVMAADLRPDSFVDPAKAKAIAAILESYEQKLCEQKLFDIGDIWRISLQQRKTEALFVLPPFVELSVREEDFLVRLASENVLRLVVPAERPEPAVFDFFRASGASSEIAEVFRRIATKNMPMDTVQIFHANSEEHLREIYLRTAAMEIPVTFAGGIPVVWSRAGRLLIHLLDWLAADYDAHLLVQMLYDGEARFSQDCFNAAKQHGKSIRKILREAPIGRGRNRYKFAEEWLQKEFEAVFAVFPVPEATTSIEVSTVAAALGQVYARWGVATTKQDIEARRAIDEFLADMALWADYQMDYFSCLERLRAGARRLRFNAEGSKAGHLHVQSYNTAGWTGRERIFFVGMNADMIPGAGLQDSVLLDDERRTISHLLEMQGTKAAKKRIQFEQIVSMMTGELVFSWKSGDLVSDREFHPSPVVLTALRAARCDEGLTYKDLEETAGRPCSCQPKTNLLLDDTDWWLSRLLANQESADTMAAVRAQFSGLDAGLAAKLAHRSEDLSSYTGLVNAQSDDLDPRRNGQVMSASRIETLAKCPFQYYLKYVLGVKPPQDFVYDPTKWLTALERGLLLHTIYERYINEWCDAGHAPAHSENIAWIERIASEEIQRFEQKVAPSSWLVREMEIIEIMQVCRKFLHLRCNNNGANLLHCEVALESESEGPLVFPLDLEQSVRFRGSIDRVDEIDPGKYHIWDYKNGTDGAYETNCYFKQGKHIQPALYAAAWEEKNRIEGKLCEVTQVGYAFPGSKARREQVVWPSNRKEDLKSILKHLFDLAAAGAFIPTPDKNCYYCDYCSICSIDDKERKVKTNCTDVKNISTAQQKNPANDKLLKPWKDVQLYD